MLTAQEKAKHIRLLISDVDGILTSGIIYYGNDGEHLRGFHIRDGLGLKLLKKAGIEVAIISAKKSAAVARRLDELNITQVYLGYEEKLAPYEKLKQMLNLKDEAIAYMGDDLPDLAPMQRAGLAITVKEAPTIIQQHADFITKKKGGKGASREACEFILSAQGLYTAVVQSYLAL